MRPHRTSLCIECGLRFERAARCPRCEAEAVDLTDATARSTALRELRRTSMRGRLLAALRPLLLPERRAATAVVWCIIFLSLAGIAVSGFLFGIAGWLLAYLLVPIVLTVAWVRLTIALKRELPTERRRIRIEPPPPPAGSARVTLRGRVRAERTLESPLEGARCVAFRIAGTDGWAEIDDAGACDFVLETEEGDLWIEAEQATVSLEPSSPSRITGPSAELRALLSERLADPESRKLRLAEAVVVPGDSIEVEGTATTRQAPAGYRGTRDIDVLREEPGSPLVIRRPRPLGAL